eukprot:TRINITY_DN40669_c0_g1_i1.p1 TRINITY_DN40669_c0_g1~~TRINITY_DN40669_c0_g1_i1.p1  ORF type:complete len:413 (-),score=22.82 TRINITY_DN40669_c0_g1_i1:89-1327(-)
MDGVSPKRHRSHGVSSTTQDDRHFVNDLDDSLDPIDWERRLKSASEAAEQRLREACHKKSSIYSGECGFYFALVRCFELSHNSADSRTLEWVQRGLEAAERGFGNNHVTFLEGLPGNLALQVAVCHRQGDSERVQKLLKRIGSFSRTLCAMDSRECEVLYGRCGYLGSILFVRRTLGDSNVFKETATEVVRQIVEAGRRDGKMHSGWPLYFEWHGKCYFGGAHGLAGILFTLLQFPDELAQCPDGTHLVRATADRLLAHRFPSGNMPSSEGSDRDRLIHWCHGPVGFIPLLLRMADFFKDSKYTEMAASMGEVVWTRGLLSTKGPGLCHGIPGNGYCFLALHRLAPRGDERWLRRAKHFAVFVADHIAELAPLCDRRFSLFEGLAGAFTFWHDVLAAKDNPEEVARFPGYEF